MAAARTDSRTELLDADLGLLAEQNRAGEPLLFLLPNNPEAALQITELLLGHCAGLRATNSIGETSIRLVRRRGLGDSADAIDAALSSA